MPQSKLMKRIDSRVLCACADADLYGQLVMACKLCRLMLIGFGVVDSENTVRAVSREGDRCAGVAGHMLQHCS